MLQVLLACGADVTDCGFMNSVHSAAIFYSECPALTEIPMLKLLLESVPQGTARDALALRPCEDAGADVLSHAAGSAAAVTYLLASAGLGRTALHEMLTRRDLTNAGCVHNACWRHNAATLGLFLSAGASFW